MERLLTEYFLDAGGDHKDRSHAAVLAWDDDKLERVHDYIQWLFPLPEVSEVNPEAPVLVNSERLLILHNQAFLPTFLAGFRRMLAFYGFLVVTEGHRPRIERTQMFAARTAVWLTPYNHNFQRISRILGSCALLDASEYAQEFLHCLEELYAGEAGAIIGSETMSYWRSAADRSPVNIPHY